MSADELDRIEILMSADLEIEGRMPWSSNATFAVFVRSGDSEHRAIYKPIRGERPLWDFEPGLHRRERAAYVVSESLGVGAVPVRVVLGERVDVGDVLLGELLDGRVSAGSRDGGLREEAFLNERLLVRVHRHLLDFRHGSRRATRKAPVVGQSSKFQNVQAAAVPLLKPDWDRCYETSKITL